jgi:hypothetical protein
MHKKYPYFAGLQRGLHISGQLSHLQALTLFSIYPVMLLLLLLCAVSFSKFIFVVLVHKIVIVWKL